MRTAGPLASEWKLRKPTHKEYVKPTLCCCETGRGPCPRPAVDCIEDKSDIASGVHIRSMCRECRVASFGLTPGEKSARTKSPRKSQVDAFAPESR